ncbi:hypothetical protein ACROYT_G042788 [Oculina patagonica]
MDCEEDSTWDITRKTVLMIGIEDFNKTGGDKYVQITKRAPAKLIARMNRTTGNRRRAEQAMELDKMMEAKKNREEHEDNLP